MNTELRKRFTEVLFWTHALSRSLDLGVPARIEQDVMYLLSEVAALKREIEDMRKVAA